MDPSDRLQLWLRLGFGNVKRIAKAAGFEKLYLLVAGLILLITTVLWSWLGASLQSNNADQLTNTYLMASRAVFSHASLPDSHTFLLKWPLFALNNWLGASSISFTVLTVGLVLATVAGLAYILWRIEKRPLVLGTIFLALASVLLLVPAQPYAGALLPANMAMLTTRNIEYIVYIASVTLFIKARRVKSWSFWLGVVLTAILIASDKLFLTLGLGGAGIALIVYALSNGWNLVSMSVRWLVGGLAGAIGGIGILATLNAKAVTHIDAQAGTFGPYGLAHGLHNLAVGIIYGIMSIFTNLGANPAYDATIVRNIPHQLYSNLYSLSDLAHLVNLLVLLIGLYIIWKIIKSSLAHNQDKSVELTNSYKLSLVLVWTSVAALIAFVVSNHYWAADERYLAIVLFTVFVSIAAFASQKTWRTERLVVAGGVIFVGILLALPNFWHTHQAQLAASIGITRRDQSIAKVLAQHPVQVLVGDYWRVVPTRLASENTQNILPLGSCTTPRSILSSTAWQPNLTKTSFAYLISFDRSQSDFPSCSLNTVFNAYGRPNTSVVIAGSQASPKELLLFYDKGAKHSAPKKLTTTPSTVLPIPLSQLPYTSCPTGTSVMNIVAHEDDDLLFMNPDIIGDLNAGRCVRTVYITAGDAGANQFYWLGREQGSEAAYSEMLGISDIWVQRIVELNDHEFVMVAHPQGNYRVSLIFMRLPDGNLQGQGFKAYNYESLANLESSKDSQLNSVDNQSYYSLPQLSAALVSLMHAFLPNEIHTQASYVSKQYPDHSDHMAVGRLTKMAYAIYETEEFENNVTIPLRFYIGYPIHAFPANVSDGLLAQKEAAWLAYAKFDLSVCHSVQECSQSGTYGSYLTRQYQNAY